MQNGTGECVGQARGGFKTRLRRQDAHGAWPARQKAGDGRWTRGVKTLRRSATTVTDRFMKTAIQCLMTMTDSAISSCHHG